MIRNLILAGLALLFAAAAAPLPPATFQPDYATPAAIAASPTTPAELQAALDASTTGERLIVLPAGTKYIGNFTVPAVQGRLVIQSSKLDGLPRPGNRVGPAQAALMPALSSPNCLNPALSIAAGAKKVRLSGVCLTTEFATRDGIQYGVARVAEPFSINGPVCEDVTLDRCLVRGTTAGNVRDGVIVYRAKRFALVDSYLDGFHGGDESHGVHLYQCDGPAMVDNCHIEAAGIGVFVGDSYCPGIVPTDIVIHGNHLFKPPSWNPRDPSFSGIPWLCKNHLEVKFGKRILITGNVMENCWISGQMGSPFLLTPYTAEIADIDFRNNRVLGYEGAISIAAQGFPISRVRISNNFLAPAKPALLAFLAAGPDAQTAVTDIEISNNCGPQSGTIGFNGQANGNIRGLSVLRNITAALDYPFFGNGLGCGVPAMKGFCTDWTVSDNVLIGCAPGIQYLFPDAPPSWTGFKLPAVIGDVGFIDPAAGNYRLSPSSPYAGLGANWDALGAATAHAIDGQTATAPPPADYKAKYEALRAAMQKALEAN